jgi:capsular polysaccharide biosynthesis protein
MTINHTACEVATASFDYDIDVVDGGRIESGRHTVVGVQRSEISAQPACVSPMFLASNDNKLVTTRLHHNFKSIPPRYEGLLGTARRKRLDADLLAGRRLFVVGGSENFYHFITNYLTRCFYYMTRQDASSDDMFLIYENMPSHFLEYLDLVGVTESRRIAVSNRIYLHCPHAIWSNLPHYFERGLHADKAAFDWLRQIVSQPANGRRRRLLLSRARAAHRRLVNEPELIRLGEKYGIEPVFPEDHSVSEILTLLGQAEVLVSTFGAGVANSLFCPADCTIVELTSRIGLTKHNTDVLGAVAGQRCIRIVGDEAESDSEKMWAYRDLVVDVRHFEIALQHLFETSEV